MCWAWAWRTSIPWLLQRDISRRWPVVHARAAWPSRTSVVRSSSLPMPSAAGCQGPRTSSRGACRWGSGAHSDPLHVRGILEFLCLAAIVLNACDLPEPDEVDDVARDAHAVLQAAALCYVRAAPIVHEPTDVPAAVRAAAADGVGSWTCFRSPSRIPRRPFAYTPLAY